MIKKLSLLMLCTIVVPGQTQAMNSGNNNNGLSYPTLSNTHPEDDVVRRIRFLNTDTTLALPAFDSISYFGAQAELMKNQQALHDACMSGDFTQAQSLLRAGVSVDSKNSNGDTPLHNASALGYTKIVKLLIKHGADVDKRNNHGRIPLHYASFHGHKEVVDWLIKCGASVERKDRDSRTSLHRACQTDHTAVIKTLLAGGASCKDKDVYGNTPLHYAIEAKNAKVVRVLVAAGADVHDIWCPLVEAVQYRAYPIVQILLEAGASAEPYIQDRPRPLRSLLEATKNVAPHGQGQEGMQALAALKALLVHGANVLLADSQGFEPIPYAFKSGNTELAHAILLDSFIPHCRYDEQIRLSYRIPSWVKMSHLIAQKQHAALLQKSGSGEKFVEFLNGHIERHFLILKKLISNYKATHELDALATQVIKPLQDASAFSELPQDFQRALRQSMLKRFLIPRRALKMEI